MFSLTLAGALLSYSERLACAQRLFAKGLFVHHAMAEQRITEDDLRNATRSTGAANPEEVIFVSLEPIGDLSMARSDTVGSGLWRGAMSRQRPPTRPLQRALIVMIMPHEPAPIRAR